jgi:hypothetical protein
VTVKVSNFFKNSTLALKLCTQKVCNLRKTQTAPNLLQSRVQKAASKTFINDGVYLLFFCIITRHISRFPSFAFITFAQWSHYTGRRAHKKDLKMFAMQITHVQRHGIIFRLTLFLENFRMCVLLQTRVCECGSVALHAAKGVP